VQKLIFSGSITTLLTNPIWTVQTAQSTKAVAVAGTAVDGGPPKKIKLSAMDAAGEILKQDGLKGFWRGIGPALILVINPVIQVSRATPFGKMRGAEWAVHDVRAARCHVAGVPAQGSRHVCY
jgi:hypothetical protein